MPPPDIFHARPRLMRVLLFFVSLILSAAIFFTLDWFHSRAVERAAPPPHNCAVADPVRHHAFLSNCSAIVPWGSDSYEFFTNSLGFRDEKVRQVPLADARSRILILGDSFTEGEDAWRDSYVGRIAAHLPQYDFLNGGVSMYSPSNYLNVSRMVHAAGVEFDEAIVFLGVSVAQDEAAYYRDIDASGAVTGPEHEHYAIGWFSKLRRRVSRHLLLTNYIFAFFERNVVKRGYYHLTVGQGDIFDTERYAWTYRKVSETEPFDAGYAPLGVEGGIAKAKAKMTLLWQELAQRHIPISVVVYPLPPQLVHDTVDSRQVRIWRDWCEGKCKRFVSTFPVFFATKDQCPRSESGCWYSRYFIFGDFHYNAAGNALVADTVIKSLEAVPPVKVQTMSDGGKGGR